MTTPDRKRAVGQPLISDTDIFRLVESVLQNDEVVAVWDAHRIMTALRDRYEARIAELEAELAATLTDLIEHRNVAGLRTGAEAARLRELRGERP